MVSTVDQNTTYLTKRRGVRRAEAFDGFDTAGRQIAGPFEARASGLAVNDDRTGTALAETAADFGAHQPEMFAQDEQ